MPDGFPTIRIDLGSNVPVYRQIADAVRTVLVAGRFATGDQLPTVRRLASSLGVHHNTVAEAYRTLADEGWLDLGRRRGATILDRKAPKARPEVKAWFSKRLRELVAEAEASGVPKHVIRGELTSLAEGD
jgi:DNA-binding transcriptional regulator YhcF (GntR family)